MLLEQIVQLRSTQEIESELQAIGVWLVECLMINEGIDIPSTDGVDAENLATMLGDAANKFDVAKKALGLVNKLSPGPSKKKNMTRVMGHMNKLRGLVRRIDKKIANMTQTAKETVSEGKLNGLEAEAQLVWAQEGLEDKKKKLNDMVDKFKAKEKQEKFRTAIDKLTSDVRADHMAANLIQMAAGDGVIK